MRLVLLLGRQPNQIALANRIASRTPLTGIVLSENVPRRPAKRPMRRFVNRVAGRLVGLPFIRAWRSLQERYAAQHPSPPDAPVVSVRNVNDVDVSRAIDRWRPDLVAVSGTNLVGKALIGRIRQAGRITNLHTGISPYVKGGPNCTNWCLSEAAFHLIGNSVMWLDAGIDSGDLIATEQTPLDGRESLQDLHWKVMEHAHDLYVDCLARLGRGESVPSTPQGSIDAGRTFYTHEWGGTAMRRALSNFQQLYSAEAFLSPEFRKASAALRLFARPPTSRNGDPPR